MAFHLMIYVVLYKGVEVSLNLEADRYALFIFLCSYYLLIQTITLDMQVGGLFNIFQTNISSFPNSEFNHWL